MTADEFIVQSRAALVLLNQNRPAETLRLALDLKALVQLRIQRSGRDFTGSRFAAYSPAYSLKRKDKGRQVGYVDLTDTGRMWNNVQPRLIASDSDTTTIIVGASDQQNKNKLLGQVKKRGNVLTPSDSEIADARAANIARIKKYLGQ